MLLSFLLLPLFALFPPQLPDKERSMIKGRHKRLNWRGCPRLERPGVHLILWSELMVSALLILPDTGEMTRLVEF